MTHTSSPTSPVPRDAAALPGGERMPLLGFGTWQLKGDQARRAVLVALDAGYRHVDTATVYGNEAEVGAALTDSGVARHEVFVTTKCPPRNAGHELETLRASLDALRTDHVDLWLVHWPSGEGADVAMWRAFLRARDEKLTALSGSATTRCARSTSCRRRPATFPP